MTYTNIITLGILLFSISLLLNHSVYAQAGNLTGNATGNLTGNMTGNLTSMIMGKSNYTQTNSTSGSWNTSSPSTSSPLNSSYLTYNDTDLGFSIQYPSDWSINNGDSEHNTVVVFESPDKDASADIRIYPKGDYESIKDYGDSFKKSTSDYKLLKYYRNSSTTLSDRPAFKVIYLSTYDPNLFEKEFGYKSETAKAMVVATMVPEQESFFDVAYFAQPTKFNDYLPVVEKMIDSFQIYGKGPIIQEDNSSSLAP